jgi:hypothetical protein
MKEHDKYQQERVVKVCSNDLAPLLDKIVDKDGKIPSGKQVSDIQVKGLATNTGPDVRVCRPFAVVSLY